MSCVHSLVRKNIALREENEKLSRLNDVHIWTLVTVAQLYDNAKDNFECAEILRHLSGPFNDFVEKYKDTDYGRTLKRVYDDAKETIRRYND